VLAALGGGVAGAPTRRAIERYTGVLYRELDWASLLGAARRRGTASVLIASGLWGMVAPGDPIPDYRLKMGAHLDGIGRLSSFWRPHLTAALASRLAGRVVWDLLPGEHAAAWVPAAVAVRRRITVRFVDPSGRTVSHWNKLLKGAVVRHLLTEGTVDPAALVDFEHPSGYRLDPVRSDLEAEVASVVLAERSPPSS
jgi:cytoplasmic iron level regulating protein YaaA (DUF328/UPF0246 family)